MRARQYTWVKCKCCGKVRIHCHMRGNAGKYYCPGKCWDSVPEAERPATVYSYSLNGKDVSREEFEAATKRPA